ncbi:hypothetical protein H6758_03085 [Candidatus Nomurabacteria bacterium]|nr:hypothetical protein [Candidatus Nomurabacteria bacterium]
MGLRKWFGREKSQVSTQETGTRSPEQRAGIESSHFPSNESPSSAQVIEQEYGGYNPESAAEGMGAVSDGLEHGQFMVPNPEKNAENPFFWKGVAASLQTEGIYGNGEAARLAVEINGMVNQAQNRDGVKTDGAKVDFSGLDQRVGEVLMHSDTGGLEKVA